ncbi:MAG: 2-oxo acid dehydrogenase subunit E2 [Sphingobacteriales bacterium]|nr:2-oxo acid dehydrogenase subunit E2 [Sphingobacteriales bacterium]
MLPNTWLCRNLYHHTLPLYRVDANQYGTLAQQNKRRVQKTRRRKRHLTPVFVEAVAKALKKFPYVNASIDGTNVILLNKINNLGVATSTQSEEQTNRYRLLN